MLVGFRNFNQPQQVNNKQNQYPRYNFNSQTTDTVSFTGMSKPSQYNSIFEFLAAKILSGKKKIIDEEQLSANNIKKGVDAVFHSNGVYGPFPQSKISEIKWRAYVPQDVRTFCVDKINEARNHRLHEWKQVLEAPQTVESLKENEKLTEKLKNNKSLRIVIWNAVNSELKENNRHIPVPFNAKALEQTIEGFEAIAPLDRKVRCKDISFLEMYTHRLRDNILTKKGISDEQTSAWVRIPSIKHDLKNKDRNVNDVEILSYKNWCTRSSVDKAEDVLKDGDFYIYLERGKNDMWQPLIGMASFEDKISQIQGVDNNNIIPLKHLPKVKEFVKSKNLKYQSGIVDEGPRAHQQVLISEKLLEQRPEIGKTFDKALKENDTMSILKYLDKKATQGADGLFEIDTYKPAYIADKNKGIAIPYDMLGVDENKLLENVSKIKGDLILDNRNPLFNSKISKFPENLKEVTGKISCTQEQFDMFGEDLKRVAKNPKNIVIHNW